MEDDEKELLKHIIKVCDCGCGILRIVRYNWSDGTYEYGIQYYKDYFGSESWGLFDRLKVRIKNAWYTLIGKDYWLYDICLTKEQFEELREEITQI